jgi:hypothetical protein
MKPVLFVIAVLVAIWLLFAITGAMQGVFYG